MIDSVNRAFSGDLEVVRDAAEPVRGTGQLDEAKTLAIEVGGLFESVILTACTTAGEGRDSIQINLPHDALFLRGRAPPARRLRRDARPGRCGHARLGRPRGAARRHVCSPAAG